MGRSTNAVLLSALVLPGAGQLHPKRFRRGIAMAAISLACLRGFVDRAMQQASTVIEKLESEARSLDAGQLSDLATQTVNSSGSTVATVATRVLAGCWVVGLARSATDA
ncbi:MAG: hypothetical protein M1449_04540 [Candidatus Thermoplasmatota archaeon]|nr:hypothetical protein [Candidatus Thermoplasmatota archaeon]